MESVAVERTLDECLDALGHVQRRKLLRALLVHNPQDDESVQVDADESDDEELKRIVGMKHVHLPKLEDYGYIDWNRDSNEISKGAKFKEIRPLLEMLAAHEDELPDEWL
ncbi:ArsR family transcriptional regulator [Halorubrum sp. DTA46]|uniref:ArsR family transcriptional regulator n=1 Tax=Halorubrum sp. DTA46 TaxID=3402162 RepID=UPI003AAB95DE